MELPAIYSQLLEKLFPFFFTLDRDLSIELKGKSLNKIIPKAEKFQDTFSFRRPRLGVEYRFDSIADFTDQIFILQIKNLPHPINLKGQFILDENKDKLIFCGSPWISNEDDFKKSQLLISDFALHDSVLDLLQVISSLRMEFDDKNTLNAEIERQKKFYENLFDNIPVDIGIFDSELRFKFLNKNAVKDDETRKWLIGRTLKDYYEFRNLDMSLADERETILRGALDKGETVRYQDVYDELSDSEKVVLRELFPYRDHNGNNYLLAYGVDITELKKGRDELVNKNKELEKINGELDSLVYSVSHDLRTPVLSIVGLIDAVFEIEDLAEENLIYLRLMRKSVFRLDDTIREILEYSRNSRTEILNTPIDLAAFVSQTFESVQYYVNYKIKLELDIQADAVFYSDQTRVTTLLNNIISNSVKYSRENDGNAFIKFSAKIDSKSCTIRLEDNGEGIPVDQQPLVFKIFHRASSSATGSGLGLFICSEIIKKLNGEITLQSTPKQGTVLTIKIPNNTPV
jgi:signal transduction histidine kinase